MAKGTNNLESYNLQLPSAYNLTALSSWKNVKKFTSLHSCHMGVGDKRNSYSNKMKQYPLIMFVTDGLRSQTEGRQMQTIHLQLANMK